MMFYLLSIFCISIFLMVFIIYFFGKSCNPYFYLLSYSRNKNLYEYQKRLYENRGYIYNSFFNKKYIKEVNALLKNKDFSLQNLEKVTFETMNLIENLKRDCKDVKTHFKEINFEKTNNDSIKYNILGREDFSLFVDNNNVIYIKRKKHLAKNKLIFKYLDRIYNATLVRSDLGKMYFSLDSDKIKLDFTLSYCQFGFKIEMAIVGENPYEEDLEIILVDVFNNDMKVVDENIEEIKLIKFQKNKELNFYIVKRDIQIEKIKNSENEDYFFKNIKNFYYNRTLFLENFSKVAEMIFSSPRAQIKDIRFNTKNLENFDEDIIDKKYYLLYYKYNEFYFFKILFDMEKLIEDFNIKVLNYVEVSDDKVAKLRAYKNEIKIQNPIILTDLPLHKNIDISYQKMKIEKMKSIYILNLKNPNINMFFNQTMNIEREIMRRKILKGKKLRDLLLMNISPNESFSYECILDAMLMMIDNGDFATGISSEVCLVNRNNFDFLYLPTAVGEFIGFFNNNIILEEKLKILTVKNKNSKNKIYCGNFDKVFPIETISDRIIKIFTSLEFDENGIKNSASGEFMELLDNEKNKSLILSMILCKSISDIIAFVKSSKRENLINLRENLKERIKNQYRTRLEKNQTKKEKIIINALREEIFGGQTFSQNFNIKDFYDLFEYVYEDKDKIKVINCRMVYWYILGLVAEGKYFESGNMFTEILKINQLNGANKGIKQYIAYDGKRFYPYGERSYVLPMLLNSLTMNKLFGIKLTRECLLIENPSDTLKEGEIKSVGKNGNMRVKFIKSGKSKVILGSVNYENIKKIPMNNIGVNKDCIIEF